jgi:predicted Holliday junction resolvase-like endonuclease
MIRDLFREIEEEVREIEEDFRRSLSGDKFDDLFDSYYENEEVRRKRKELEEAKERARKGWVNSRYPVAKKRTSLSLIPEFGESSELFEKRVGRWAKEHPDYRIDARDVKFPNGYYRSVEIRNKRTG